jgi:hypothetical protein
MPGAPDTFLHGMANILAGHKGAGPKAGYYLQRLIHPR